MSVRPATAAPAAATGARLRPSTRFAYGAFAIPLAMGALPLYVHLPKFYGEVFGIGLASLGFLLLALRAADALVDPLLGALSDRGPARKRLIAWSAPVLAFGMIALFEPQVRGEGPLLAWLACSLALVYAAYSLATINHNAWGAELSTDPDERTRITATREGLALAGVVAASVLPGFLAEGSEAAGLPRYAWLYAAIVAACLAATLAAPEPPREPASRGALLADVGDALRDRLFLRLVAVFALNGIAAAIPATLFLFYVADVLHAEGRQGWLLALYFVAGAAGLPVWTALAARVGKTVAWAASMIVAVAAFVWAALLGPGDVVPFAIVCVMSGAALGADLALPPSILADVIGRRGAMRSTGAYFGVWTLVTKLNLALAAGIALPLIEGLGYSPGARDATATLALAIVYAAVPCALKLAALAALVSFSSRSHRDV